MKKKQHTYLSTNWLKGLLLVPLLFSFFTFSGYTSGETLQQTSRARTELLIMAGRTKTASFSFKKAFAKFHQNTTTPATLPHYLLLQVVLHYNRLINTHFEEYVKKLDLPFGKLFTQRKIIPKSSEEDLFNLCKG